MKSLYLRSGLALLCGAILSACGGSDGSLQLSGSITGLTKDGLVLVNEGNGDTYTVPTTNRTNFQFGKLLSVDDYFKVSVKLPQPVGATCVASNNEGKANVYNAYYVVITCTADPRWLGGTVANLKGEGLIMANGTDTVAVPKGAVSFTFPHQIGDGSNYGIRVFQQPAGQQCTIPTTGAGTGIGTIGNQNLTDAAVVTCVDTPSA
jgi:hypothetical protein